ncbi:hypothetical protein P4S60_18300 [Pseudoalteromonas sp. Hal040]|uniref:hypothetical protein n=1 Tax=unclassified Pseudoalteromonas TaxID=194690 RepID=UPI00203EFC37|nr:hypothetical protein [Pseudoalteromonas sp. NCCP-2140]GKW51782.1 hypothetical protein NCCP2140_08350 [Pseudoalteromonas sp. NCCP-2140]
MKKSTHKLIMKHLFSKYKVKHGNDVSYIENYSFGFLCLSEIEGLKEQVNSANKPNELLEVLTVGGYLKEYKVRYYFTEKGFNDAWKISEPIGYFFTKHWQWAIGIVGIGLLIATATALSG